DLDSRVRMQNVDAAEPFHGVLNQLENRRAPADIAFHGERLSAGVLDLACGLIGCGLFDIRQHHDGALRTKQVRRGTPDPVGCTGYDDNLFLNSPHGSPSVRESMRFTTTRL